MAEIIWKPHKKQEAALLAESFEVLYGGARGGGKTDAGIAWLLYPILNPTYRALVIRKNSTDLHDWIDRAERMYASAGGLPVGNPPEFHFPSGAKIITGHLKDAQAYTKYQGHEYQRILIEELTQIPTEESYLKLISSCRSTNGIIPQIFATANPGGIGHSWVKKRFIDPKRPMMEYVDSQGLTRTYIPATVDDNPTLQARDPKYIKFLDSLPPDLREMWRHGNWDIVQIKGAYYTEDIMQAQKENRICKLATLPYDPVYVAWDLGISDDQVAIFYQVKGDEIRIIDCYDDTGKAYSFYVNMLREKGYTYAKMMLPHDASKRAPDSLRTFKSALEEAGFVTEVIPRTKDKQRDIQRSREIFPRAWFDSEKCAILLDSLQQYRRLYSEERGAYEDKPYHNFASNFADAWQALAVSLPNIKPKKNYEDSARKFIIFDAERKPIDGNLGIKANDYENYQRSAKQFLNK